MMNLGLAESEDETEDALRTVLEAAQRRYIEAAPEGHINARKAFMTALQLFAEYTAKHTTVVPTRGAA
jgi:hypothetical protein